MKYDPDIHHRRSIRLKGYDYSSAGVYFITICTQNKECLFGIVGAAPRGRPFNSTRGRPFDSGDGRPFDSGDGRPFDSGDGRPETNLGNGEKKGNHGELPLQYDGRSGKNDLGRHRDLPLQYNTRPDSTQMILNDAGKMILNIWEEIPKYYDGIDIDEFQIMPNHIHGIIIVGAGPRACPSPRACPGTNRGNHGELPVQCNGIELGGRPRAERGRPRGAAPTGLSLSDVVERFKSLTTKKYIDGVKLNKWKPFDKRLWQRNYYEHIVRNDDELNRIREYINNNPVNWETDEEFKK